MEGLLAVELLAELADELPLGPREPLIIKRDCKQAELAPPLLFDLLWRAPFAAVATRYPPHGKTSDSNAA